MPTAEDFEAIRQILAGYCHLVDQAVAKGETPDTSALYHPDAVYSNSFENGIQHVGHAAVVAWYHKFLGKRSGYYRYMRHKIFEPYIVINGDKAKSRTHFDADSVDREGMIRGISGRYEDDFVKSSGQWLIAKRHVEVHYHHTIGAAHPFKGWS
jgi:SnoaL-like domain